jgi:hypothetical protein
LIRYIKASFSILDGLLILYNPQVQSETEYASVAWNSVSSTDSAKLKELKYILYRYVAPDSLTVELILCVKTSNLDYISFHSMCEKRHLDAAFVTNVFLK